MAFLLSNLRKFLKFGGLGPEIFVNKFLKISKKFSWICTAFQNRKKLHFVLKLMRIRNIDKNLAKISLKTPKSSNFAFKS